MKKILLSFLILFPFNLSAEKTIDYQHQKELCASFSKFSESAMRARQNGVSMSEMLKSVALDMEPAKNIEESIIKEVFKYPKFDSKEKMEVAVQDYVNYFYRTCIS
ncbi:hypothetical protein [Acinetobacter guillouiae]|uniref:hypothetical protein n=1 Tax=Acinetobacter guillouiae TaxID=106649 RepID=UPI002FD8D4CE